MSDAPKTLREKVQGAWDELNKPHKPGVEAGADLQAQAAAYDLENASPSAEEAARNAADLAAAKTEAQKEEAVSGLRGHGEALESVGAGAGSAASSAKANVEHLGSKVAEANSSAEKSAHATQESAVQQMREAGTHIAEGMTTARGKAGEAVTAVKEKLGL